MKQGNAVVWLVWPQQVSTIDFRDSGTFVTNSAIVLVKPETDMTISGWHRLGMATIQLDFDPSPASLAAPAVQALQASLAKFDAECQEKRNYILDQIGKLSAIGFDEGAV